MEEIPDSKKHSSGDLHSRLKTRKLLGVGSTDDGDVHRSKLSQILGHSCQLYTKLPPGLQLWQLLHATCFTLTAAWALLLPESAYRVATQLDAEACTLLPTRLYGTTLIALSIIYWAMLNVKDKELIRWSILSSLVFYTAHIILLFLHSPILSWLSLSVLTRMLLPLAVAGIDLYYYRLLRLPASQYTGKSY